MSKMILDNAGLTDDFFIDTRLIGIMAPIKNYKFCWNINHSLGFNFRLAPDIEKQLHKKGRKYFFEVYHHIENPYLDHYIYDNKNDGEFLLPEFKHIDFLWLIKGDFLHDQKSIDLFNSVKAISQVQLVAELTNEKIKNKEHIVI